MEPSAAGDRPEENAGGPEGQNLPASKAPVAKKRSCKPKSAIRGAAARIRAKALSSRKALKAQEKKEAASNPASDGGDVAAKGGKKEEKESPLADEAGTAATPALLTKEARPTGGSPSRPPDGAAEPPLSQPMKEEEAEVLPRPTASNQEKQWEEPSPKKAKPNPEATFTPTAAGLRPKEAQEPEMTARMRQMISEAIAQGIAAGIQQNQQAASPAPDNALPQARPAEPDNASEVPGGFTGLFRPSLFKSLLAKAKATARMGVDSSASDQSLGLSDPNNWLFSEPTTDSEEIPSPKLFLDVVQRQWTLPGAYPAASQSDKRLYNVAPNLTAALQLPVIDAPVAALTSTALMSNDAEDALNPENRRAEMTLRKAHQAAAFAVKAATAASFFNRTSLLWLKQLQDKIPATDVETHQDLKNLIAAAEFSADATLNSVRYASRTIGAFVSARRLLWLRHWRADMKSKWKLASSPFKGDKLFGESLDPILIETKDKKKILPTLTRPADRRSSGYYRSQSYRAGDPTNYLSQPQRAYFQRQDRLAGYRGMNRQQFQSKQSFQGRGGRGNGGRPFNRSSR